MSRLRTLFHRGRPAVATALGVAMLVVAVAAAWVPNAGALPAQVSCQYGVCTNSQTGIQAWQIALVVLLILIALIVAVLLLRRRRPPEGAPEPWSGPAYPGEAAPEGAVAPEQPAVMPPSAAYLETPEDVGTPMPEPAVPPAAPAPGGADIDSLLKELDTISGEILKRGQPPKKTAPKVDDDGDNPPPPD
ncbi:MAG TPA: hypothetical protein VFF67_05065 [Thermoplasmata archaeon]|nr:hypothetical protein [Thermoplasmata archaeon]